MSYRHPMRSVMWIGVVAALGIVPVARAQMSVGQPQLFTIEAIAAPDQAAAAKVGYDPLSVGFADGPRGEVRWIGVVAARSLDGDAFQGKQVVENLLPNSPNLLVAGPAPLVAKLRAVPNGSRVVLQGILNPPTRNYLLDKVEILKAPTGG